MSGTPKFWHTYVITYSDFMVILEPCIQMSQILKIKCNFTLRWLLDLGSTSLEQSLSLKTSIVNCSLSLLFCYLLVGCPMANLWLLSRKQSHSSDVNHCIWAINFWRESQLQGLGLNT